MARSKLLAITMGGKDPSRLESQVPCALVEESPIVAKQGIWTSISRYVLKDSLPSPHSSRGSV